MNYRIIIHALILIFIIHIVIINIDYEVNIGNKKENFENYDKKKSDEKDNESLNFLLENKDNDNEFINKMKTLSKSVEKPTKDVLPSNGYLNNENVPNFEGNVEDTSKFYNIQNSYDNLNENDLQSTPLNELKKESNNIITDINKVNNNRESKEKPTTWEYNNEFAMNGGLMNGIAGFDGLESQYANFGNQLNMKDETKTNFENVPHDDLRKPVVVN